MTTTTISLINLKGGVGKTTLTFGLADFLALEYQYRVLVVDLDPQTNATISLISQDKWKEQDDKGQTLRQLFQDALDGTKHFRIDKAIIKNVSNIRGGIENLHLLPSSLGLIDIQDQLAMIATSSMFARKPTMMLKQALDPVKHRYDFILVDCPPNLGTITLNGLLISDFYLIPTIPDTLSTYGIPQISRKVREFSANENLRLKPMGIVLTKYRESVRLHRTTEQWLHRKAVADPRYPGLLKTKIPFTVKAEEAADFDLQPNTFNQKYGDARMVDVFRKLAEEIHEHIE